MGRETIGTLPVGEQSGTNVLDLTEEERFLLERANDAAKQANHQAVVYEHRAHQIARWFQVQNFVSLGVAPGLILAITVRDSETTRAVAFALSAVCSLAAWLWSAFSYTFKWESQQSGSDDASNKARRLSQALLRASLRLRNSSLPRRELVKDEVDELLKQSDELRADIAKAKIAHSPELEVIAQQDTLRRLGGTCGQCGKSWTGEEKRVFTRPADVHRFFRKKRKEFETGTRCDKCAQPIK